MHYYPGEDDYQKKDKCQPRLLALFGGCLRRIEPLQALAARCKLSLSSVVCLAIVTASNAEHFARCKTVIAAYPRGADYPIEDKRLKCHSRTNAISCVVRIFKVPD